MKIKTQKEIEDTLEQLVDKFNQNKHDLDTVGYHSILSQIKALKWVLGIDEIERRFKTNEI